MTSQTAFPEGAGTASARTVPDELDAAVAQPIRVCILAPSLNTLGGQSRQAVRLMTGLSKEAVLSVNFIPHDPRLPGPLRHLRRIKYVRTITTALYYWAHLVTRLWKYDVVHVFSASYYSYLLNVLPAILIGKLYGKKVLVNYRSGEADDHLANWKLTAIPGLRLADMIVTPSEYLVDVFARFGLQARSIYNVVELDAFAYRERTSIRPVFLTNRLLEPLYNVPCVLRAFAVIQSRYPEARLTVAGEGYLRPQLEALARELGLKNTTFVGRVPFEKMPELYDGADIYLMAPDLDNMPGSVIECQSCGLPVVSTDAGGVPYIVTNEETALLVPRGDHQALAAAAIRLLEDNDLALRLTRAGRESVQKYTWPRVRAQWLQAYAELTGETG